MNHTVKVNYLAEVGLLKRGNSMMIRDLIYLREVNTKNKIANISIAKAIMVNRLSITISLKGRPKSLSTSITAILLATLEHDK